MNVQIPGIVAQGARYGQGRGFAVRSEASEAHTYIATYVFVYVYVAKYVYYTASVTGHHAS
jgi:hypothetical protein